MATATRVRKIGEAQASKALETLTSYVQQNRSMPAADGGGAAQSRPPKASARSGTRKRTSGGGGGP